MVTYVFPGQGSQKKGMGASLFNEFPELTAQAETILGYSIKKLCLEDTDQQLNQTQYTQPALYVVNALFYYKKLKETGAFPDFVAGHSLGEYNALLAAGGVDFETGLKLVQKRGELMSLATGGAMAAILKSDENEIRAILEQNDLTAIDIANYNAPGQIVISGRSEDVKRAANVFKEVRLRCTILKVSGAFHSRYMRPAREEFETFIKQFKFSELKIPVISNVHARPYLQNEIMANLADQMTHSVQWTETVRYLMAQGEMEFEEVGPGKVLTNLIKRIQ